MSSQSDKSIKELPEVDTKPNLKDLGLTQNESKVYETLLRFGATTAAHLSKESLVPYGRIYNVLESLEEKGFVRVIPDSTKKYAATDPDKLQKIIDEKIKSLNTLHEEIKNYKKLYDNNAKEPVIIAKGKSNFYKIVKELRRSEKYNYDIKYNFELRPEFIINDKILKERGSEKRSLGRINEETIQAAKEWSNIHPEIKPIPNEGIAMSIIDDEEVMIALIKSNTTLLIRDKPFAKIMKELFSKYYETAEEISQALKRDKK